MGNTDKISPLDYSDYRDYLRSRFEVARKARPQFTQGAFARAIGLPPNRLSEVFSRKQGLSAPVATQIATRLGLQREEATAFLDLVRAAHARSRSERRNAEERLADARQRVNHREIPAEAFALISSWHYFAMLELLQGGPHLADDFCRRLNLPEPRVIEALKRLRQLGLVRREPQGWVMTEKPLEVVGGVPSSAVQGFHRQLLQKAAHALTAVPVSEREFITLMLRVNPTRMPHVKKRIAEFWKKLEKELETDEDRTSLYALAVQWFPLGS